MAVYRRPRDVPRSTLIDIEQPGVRKDEPLGCSTVNVAVSFRSSPNILIGITKREPVLPSARTKLIATGALNLRQPGVPTQT
jgi:hypothetical protein